MVFLDDSDDENCAPSSPPHVTNGHNNNADVVARVDQSVICISSDDEDESSPQPKRLRLESPKIHIFKILILIETPAKVTK